MIHIAILRSRSGDWECLYINGELVTQNTQLTHIEVLRAVMLKLNVDCEVSYGSKPDKWFEGGTPHELEGWNG